MSKRKTILDDMTAVPITKDKNQLVDDHRICAEAALENLYFVVDQCPDVFRDRATWKDLKKRLAKAWDEVHRV